MPPSLLVAVSVLPGSAGGKACWGALQPELSHSGGVDGSTPSMDAVLGDAQFG